MTDRTCARCGTSAAEADFSRDRRSPDGLGSLCRGCKRAKDRAAYAANPEQHNERTRTYYARHRETVATQQREYRAANIERIRQYDRDRYAADPAGRSAHVSAWAAANRERLRETKAAYYADNRDRLRDAADIARVDAAGFGAATEPIIRREVWESYEGLCGICLDEVGFESMELDHITPVSKGGSHTYGNVQPAHKTCNSGKRDREG